MKRKTFTLSTSLRSLSFSLLILIGFISSSRGQGTFEKIYGTSLYDVANSMEITTDGGFIMVGQSGAVYDTCTADIALVKCDSDGSIDWTQTYYAPTCDAAYGIKQTADHGYMVT